VHKIRERSKQTIAIYRSIEAELLINSASRRWHDVIHLLSDERVHGSISRNILRQLQTVHESVCVIMIPTSRRRHYKMTRGVCPSVCLSVCQVPRPNSRMERSRKSKIGRMEADHTSNPWTYLEVTGQRSRSPGRLMLRPKVYHSYISNGKVYEVQTWYTDGTQRSVSSTSAMTYKVRGQGRDVTWCIWQVLAHKSRTKSPTGLNTKISRKIARTMRTSFKAKGQGHRVEKFKNAIEWPAWVMHSIECPITSSITFAIDYSRN